ncbi:HNH endonuclease [Arthrobacter woluwensis]|uniref:HNH endonuclease n=1 Tax=Arthrobacter woluwensis TaxID=156980 RepID=A0A1H4W9E2_9MICC|nr:HNH endonuclease [Arthrobacter woluwensis]SEC95786.1 HNH endonuclease [Arthrobacter woluwensis]
MTDQERFWAKVRRGEACWEWNACITPDGYGQFGLGGRVLLAHRVSYEFEHGAVPPGLFVDHICHNRACVRPSHLRLVTQKQNQENHAGAHRNSKSGVRGVFWDRQRGMWRAKAYHHGRQVHAGFFAELADAEAAVIAKRNELFTHNDMDRRPR